MVVVVLAPPVVVPVVPPAPPVVPGPVVLLPVVEPVALLLPVVVVPSPPVVDGAPVVFVTAPAPVVAVVPVLAVAVVVPPGTFSVAGSALQAASRMGADTRTSRLIHIFESFLKGAIPGHRRSDRTPQFASADRRTFKAWARGLQIHHRDRGGTHQGALRRNMAGLR